MNSAVKDIESKVQFWSLVGPLTIACILLIVILRSTASIILPAVAVSGVLLCYKWKWRGLIGALGLLITAFGFLYGFTSIDWLWSSILGLSIASAFTLTVLSFDQSGYAFEAVKDQSERYKETINQLDERLRGFQEKSVQEQQDFKARVEQLESQIENQKSKTAASEKAVALVRDELAHQEEHQRRLMQELYEARQYAHQLEQQLSTACYTTDTPSSDYEMNAVVDSASAQITQDSNAEIITKYESEIVSLRNVIEESELRYHRCLQDMQQQAVELTNLKELQDLSNRSSAVAEEQQIIQQAVTQELNDHIENLTREKQLLESTLVRLQGELEELIAQEEERTKYLTDSQATIAQLQSTLANRESALEQEVTKFHSYKSSSEIKERDLILQVEELSRKWAGVSQQIGDWQRKLDDYHLICEKARKFQQQIDLLTLEKNQLEAQSAELASRSSELEKQNLEAIQQTQALISALQEAQMKQLPDADEEQMSPDLDREIRRLTGLYNQLKEQFADKSAVLDAARKELFMVQEKLHAVQLDNLENTTYGEDAVSREMSYLLAKAEEERTYLEHEYQREIHQLHELIEAIVSNPHIPVGR